MTWDIREKRETGNYNIHVIIIISACTRAFMMLMMMMMWVDVGKGDAH